MTSVSNDKSLGSLGHHDPGGEEQVREAKTSVSREARAYGNAANVPHPLLEAGPRRQARYLATKVRSDG